MRALALAWALTVAGCGDDTSSATAADMSAAAADLSGQAHACGSSGVMQSCASAFGNIGCYICDLSGGVCARPCMLLSPDCPAGQQCHELVNTGDGGQPMVSVEGACTDYGYCR